MQCWVCYTGNLPHNSTDSQQTEESLRRAIKTLNEIQRNNLFRSVLTCWIFISIRHGLKTSRKLSVGIKGRKEEGLFGLLKVTGITHSESYTELWTSNRSLELADVMKRRLWSPDPPDVPRPAAHQAGLTQRYVRRQETAWIPWGYTGLSSCSSH